MILRLCRLIDMQASTHFLEGHSGIVFHAVTIEERMPGASRSAHHVPRRLIAVAVIGSDDTQSFSRARGLFFFPTPAISNSFPNSASLNPPREPNLQPPASVKSVPLVARSGASLARTCRGQPRFGSKQHRGGLWCTGCGSDFDLA
eukprot:scaffold7052_cov254-Pinguiococcus_pyrenoidosus.AAC.74